MIKACLGNINLNKQRMVFSRILQLPCVFILSSQEKEIEKKYFTKFIDDFHILFGCNLMNSVMSLGYNPIFGEH
jgi:hypothetical protein